MYCGNCSAKLREGKQYCFGCGTEKGKGEKYCVYCGAKLEPEQKFCRGCGKKVKLHEKEPTTIVKKQPQPPPKIKGRKYSSIVSGKGKSLTIPKQVRDFLSVEPGITVVFILQEDRVVIQVPMKKQPEK